jgi:hypothetical protein
MATLRAALCLLFVSVVASAQPPATDEIVVPPADGRSGLCVPFDCATRIQQVFDASTFPSMIRIEAIDLFNNVRQSAEGFVEPAHYQVFLSQTAVSSTTATTDMDGNLGPRTQLVADFTVSDFNTFFTGAFRIPLSVPFVYNPRQGNLLLEIRKDQTANFGDGTIYVDGTTSASGVAIVTDQFGVQPSFGMSVGFAGQLLGRR